MDSIRTWGGKIFRRFSSPAVNDTFNSTLREPHHLERIASCACSGYFHAGYSLDAFVFNAELPLRH